MLFEFLISLEWLKLVNIRPYHNGLRCKSSLGFANSPQIQNYFPIKPIAQISCSSYMQAYSFIEYKARNLFPNLDVWNFENVTFGIFTISTSS